MLRTADDTGPGERLADGADGYVHVKGADVVTRHRLTRMSGREADAATVLRVVSVFDELVEQRASAADLVRSVALWTDCAAGLSGHDGRVLARCDRHGMKLPGCEPEGGTYREAHSHGFLSGRLWIERDGPARALDELVLGRGARAAQLTLERMARAAAACSPVPGLVELLIDANVSLDERSRAGRELGYDPNQSIRVWVAQMTGGAAGVLDRVARRIRASGGGPVRVADFGASAILVASGRVDPDGLLLAGMEGRIGIGPLRSAVDAPRSYHGARAALRFAQGPGAPTITQFDQLGSVAALAGVVDTDLIDFPDWIALDQLSRTETGLTAILTAETLMHTGSQRDAAARMNLHHSTVAHRVSHFEQALGYGLGEHQNWFRAQLAIYLWRLTWSDPSAPADGGQGPTSSGVRRMTPPSRQA